MPDFEPPFVRKATAVLLRGSGGAGEVLVFTHPESEGSGPSVQLPAGTVEEGEEPADAAVRELAEETGVTGAEVIALLGVLDEPSPEAYSAHTRVWAPLLVARRRWIYQLEAKVPSLDQWAFTCDCGAPIECHWLPLYRAVLDPAQQPWLDLARSALRY